MRDRAVSMALFVGGVALVDVVLPSAHHAVHQLRELASVALFASALRRGLGRPPESNSPAFFPPSRARVSLFSAMADHCSRRLVDASFCMEGLRIGALAMITAIWSPRPRPSGSVSAVQRLTQGRDSTGTNHRGSYRQRGTAILLERESEPELLKCGVVFRFTEVLDPANLLTYHDYTVEPSCGDLRKVIEKCYFGCCSPKKRTWSLRLAPSVAPSPIN